MVVFLVIAIILVILLKPKENIQAQEIKLEQKEEVVEEVKQQTVKVDIKGNIANPGVYELEQGSRVIDAINMAGGLLENSNTELINLSQILKDEMIIIIYTNEQIEKYRQDLKQIEYVYIEIEKCPDKINDACINQNQDSTKEDDNQDKITEENTQEELTPETNNNLISINEADSSKLTTLPGIGEAKAKDIIEYRETNGKFQSIEDIQNVKGIGKALFEKIKDLITI